MFHGQIIWLTPEQGGRSSGPPAPREYRVTGYAPPFTLNNGLASFWLSDFDAGAWRSPAAGRWPMTPNEGAQHLQPGSLVVVTEGHRTVGYFHVHEVALASS